MSRSGSGANSGPTASSAGVIRRRTRNGPAELSLGPGPNRRRYRMPTVPNPVDVLRDRMSRPLVKFDHSTPGTRCVGTVVELAEGDGEYGTFPIVTIDTGTELVSIVCARSVLRREILGRDIRLGDALGVEFLG